MTRTVPGVKYRFEETSRTYNYPDGGKETVLKWTYGRRASFYAKDKKLRDLLVFHEERISSSFVQRTLMTRKRKSGETTRIVGIFFFL